MWNDGELASWAERRDLIRAPPCLPVAPETRMERAEGDMLDAREDNYRKGTRSSIDNLPMRMDIYVGMSYLVYISFRTDRRREPKPVQGQCLRWTTCHSCFCQQQEECHVKWRNHSRHWLLGTEVPKVGLINSRIGGRRRKVPTFFSYPGTHHTHQLAYTSFMP